MGIIRFTAAQFWSLRPILVGVWAWFGLACLMIALVDRLQRRE